MADYQITDKANAELDQIYEYSILNFGLKKAQEYFGGFHDCFTILAENPRMGRDYSHVKTGTRRHEYESHSIYYTLTDTGILIVQILHKNQDPGLNLLKKLRTFQQIRNSIAHELGMRGRAYLLNC